MISQHTLQILIFVVKVWNYVWLSPCIWDRKDQYFRPSHHFIALDSSCVGLGVEFWKLAITAVISVEGLVCFSFVLSVIIFGSTVGDLMLLGFVCSALLIAFSIHILFLSRTDQVLEFLYGLLLFDRKLGKFFFFLFKSTVSTWWMIYYPCNYCSVNRILLPPITWKKGWDWMDPSNSLCSCYYFNHNRNSWNICTLSGKYFILSLSPIRRLTSAWRRIHFHGPFLGWYGN